jgi:hypothetical protein
MRTNLEETQDGLRDHPCQREDEGAETTQPIRVVPSQAGGPRNSRAPWLKKNGEPLPPRTLDWTEIGDPAA